VTPRAVAVLPDGAYTRRMVQRLLVLAVGCLAATAEAQGPEAPSLAERTARADRVALVEIGEGRTVVPGGDVRRMLTLTEVTVLQKLKGEGPSRLVLVQAGGRSGPWEAHATGDARLVRGERAVLFLLVPEKERPETCTLSGLGLGKLEVSGEEVMVSGARRSLGTVVEEIRRAAAAPARGGGR